MENLNMERLLLSLFEEDINTNQQHNYISQLTVILIKSLIPMMDKVGVTVDYTRFQEELKLWKYYRNGENKSLINTINGIDPSIYWLEDDDTIYARIIPILIANEDYKIIEEEIIKNVLFTTGNIKTLLETITIGNLIYLLINKKDYIVDNIKERIIGFSQLDYLDKYEEHYKISIKDYYGNFKIDFEKEKILLLNLLNGAALSKYFYLEDCLNVFQGNSGNTLIGRSLYKYINNISVNSNLSDFYKNISNYLIKLRKSRIDPNTLKIKEYILPDVFQFKEGDEFYHSLLNGSKVVKKQVKADHVTSLIQSKSGLYLFKK
jgi:hypothetical protein